MTINLLEIDFPYQIIKDSKLTLSKDLFGSSSKTVSLNLMLNKISDSIFTLSGNIQASFINQCQSCFKDVPVFLDLLTKVTILDSLQEPLEEKNFQDIHYQLLTNLSINDLVIEELTLNYPSIVFCEDDSCVNKYKSMSKRENPFKKLKDLLE